MMPRKNVDLCRMQYIPKKLDKCRDSTRLEDGKQTLTMVWKVVQGTCCTACGFNIFCVGHCTDKSCYHLRGVHYSMTASFFLRQLVHHHCCLVDYNLIFIIQQFDQLGDSSCSQVSIILKSSLNFINMNHTSFNNHGLKAYYSVSLIIEIMNTDKMIDHIDILKISQTI